MRSSSSEPTAAEHADVRASVARDARFSPSERVSAREPAGAVSAEIEAEFALEGVVRAEPLVRTPVAAATPAAR